MHRARGSSVPSRRRIRRPGSTRRAAARRPGSRCPRVRPPRRAHCAPSCAARSRAPSPPAARARPTARLCTSGPRRPPGRPGMHVNLEKVAGRAGLPSAAGRGRPWGSALSLSSGTKVPGGAGRRRRDQVLRATLVRGGSLSAGTTQEPGTEEPHDSRRGTWPCACSPRSHAAKSCGSGHRSAFGRFRAG
jgi:hypothetical protein